MKHLILFENFLNEKMGMPPGLTDSADDMAKYVSESLLDMLQRDNDRTTMWFNTGGYGYPMGEVECRIVIRKAENSPRMYTEGGIMSGTLELFDLGNNVRTYKIKMEVSFTGTSEMFEDLRKKLVKDKSAAADIVRDTIYHEFTHIYEAYKRKSTNALELHKVDTLVYDTMGKQMRSRFGGLLPKAIKDFFYLVYLAQATEVSARVPEAYSALAGIEDPHEREAAIRKTVMWNQANDMINYNAQDYIDNAKHEITIEQWDEFNRTVTDSMDTLLRMIDKNLERYLTMSKKDDIEDKTKAKQLLKPNMRKGVDNATSSIEKFMKEWQGIINRAGEKLKKKLTKVITAPLQKVMDPETKAGIKKFKDERKNIMKMSQFEELRHLKEAKVYVAQKPDEAVVEFNRTGPMQIVDRWNLVYKDMPVGSAFININNNGHLALREIEVTKGIHNKGIGTAFMEQLCKTADRNNWTVVLTPDGYKGSSVGRLKEFYKRFGFVENKGRNKDFRIWESMYRMPGKVSESESHDIEYLRDSVMRFINMYNGKAGEDEFGDGLEEIRKEIGSCAMVSNTLVDFLKDDGYNIKTITRELHKHRDEDLGMDGTHHTAVIVDGETVIDLTFAQFDEKSEYPLILPYQDWIRML